MIVNILFLTLFFLLSIVIFIFLGLGHELSAMQRKRKKAKALKPLKATKLAQLRRRRQKLLTELKIPAGIYWLMVGSGALGGGVLGKLFFHHPFFAGTVALLGAFAPQVYLQVRLSAHRGSFMDKLHASMMILSNSYIVTEDFIRSVQDNIAVLEYPVPFKNFLLYVSLLDGSVKTGLRRMERQVNNMYFSQWIDALVLAQDDRSMKYVTMSVVDTIGDLRQAQRESDTAMYSIWREYFTVLILIFAAPLIFKMLMPQAYIVLVTSLPGQILLVLLIGAVVFSVVKAVKLNRPLLA